MSTAFFDISAALDDNLNNLVGKPPIAWQNRSYTPVTGTLYVRPTHLPAAIEPETIGSNGEDLNEGIYQIDIFSESGKSKKELLEMADKITDQFKHGTILTYNGVSVEIKSTGIRSFNNNSDGWYQVSIDVIYYSFTARR